MKAFRRLSIFSATLAIAAWANVQVMACCWSFSCSHQTVAKIETVEMASGHACCHKQADAAALVSGLPVGTVALHGMNADCRGQHDAPALQSYAHSLDLVVITSVPFNSENHFIPSSSLSATPVRDTGPPRYLALQRFLI